MEKIVRVNNRDCQCTITIPISIAREVGLDKAGFAMVKIIEGKKLEVRKIEVTESKERRV